MKMDIQTPLIFVSLFSLASVLLIFIYKFGIKEKSYEEALAEQRQQTHVLLGIKPKSKDKKNKKLTKKVKEKSGSETEVTNVEKIETATNEIKEEPQKKPHVEFKEVPEELPMKDTPLVAIKKPMKKEKVRPILVHKEKSENEAKFVKTENVSSPANHFEELHPKDDFELFRGNGVEEHVKEKEETEKSVKPSKPESDTQKQPSKKQESVPPPQKENPPGAPTPINGVISNSGKEKKKKKSEFNTLQQLAGDSNGPNMSVLLNLVRKAELSRSEVQILIDLLLNKQHEAPAVLDEWSEGKSDPVQKLKKQLAEKEKLLLEEQQIVASAQTKLKEIRAEHQAEKTVLVQKVRGLDEAFQTKQVEATRLHQQVQQLQAQIKEEVMKNHKLRDEQTALQMQRQQIEMRLAQTQESEVIITQLQNEVQELSTINNQLRLELTRLSEENCNEKERQQGFIVQLSSFQKELEQKSEYTRQLEESRLEVERSMEKVLKQEADMKTEISRLNSVLQQQNEEIRRLEHGKKQYQDELIKHKDETSKLINQLKTDMQSLQEENIQIQATQVNGSIQENKHEVEILNLHNELSSIKTQLTQAEKKNESELKAANALTAKLQGELNELEKKLEEGRLKLEEQKEKNNELRTKNWKVMEALNAAESRIKSKTKSKSDKDIQREFIKRLFPEIKELESISSEVFEVDSEKYIRKYVDDLRKQSKETEDVHQLKSQIQHYKNVIDSTEKMLNKLQKHIEHEEINWRMQLAAKTAELDSLKENYSQELQEKLTRLEAELREEQEDKQKIITQFQEFKNTFQNGLQKLPEAQVCNPSNGLH